MKHFYLALFFFSSFNSFSQTTWFLEDTVFTYKGSCSNLNEFRLDEEPPLFFDHAVHIREFGRMVFSQTEVGELGSFTNLTSQLSADELSNFPFDKSITSFGSDSQKMYKYQQFHDGVKVSNGGFTILAENNSLDDDPQGLYGPDHEPFDPCLVLQMIVPYVYSNITISTTPIVEESELAGILNITDNDIQNTELNIVHNLVEDCEYNLIWKVTYQDTINKMTFINAKDGSYILTRELGMYLNAPTEDYGTVNLDDTNNLGITSLITSDGIVSTYDFNEALLDETYESIQENDYLPSMIPSTSDNSWSPNLFPASVYQAHYVSNKVREAIDEHLDITFTSLRVGANLTSGTAGVPENWNQTINNASLLIGSHNGNTMAVYDIVAHELGHIVCYHLGIRYDDLDEQIIHEGVADIIGVYIASKINGSVNWKMGSDVPYASGRDLSRPFELVVDWTTHSGLSQIGASHAFSRFIGHFYFILSEGSGSFSGIGMEEALSVILDATTLVGAHPSLLDFIETTVELVEMRYDGVCSSEAKGARNAWDLVYNQNTTNTAGISEEASLVNDLIIEYSNNLSCFGVTGNVNFCEESNYANFTITGGLPNVEYKWTLIGKYSSEFNMTGNGGNQNGNNYSYSNQLYLTDFPNMPYYPKQFTLKVYDPTTNRIVKKKFKINDCDQDDLTCEEYYNPSGSNFLSSNKSVTTGFDNDFNLVDRINAYDVNGRLIYEGKELIQLQYNGILILTYFDKNGKLLKVEKKFNINR